MCALRGLISARGRCSNGRGWDNAHNAPTPYIVSPDKVLALGLHTCGGTSGPGGQLVLRQHNLLTTNFHSTVTSLYYNLKHCICWRFFLYLNMYPVVVMCLSHMLHTHNSVNLFHLLPVSLDTLPGWGMSVVSRCLPATITRATCDSRVDFGSLLWHGWAWNYDLLPPLQLALVLVFIHPLFTGYRYIILHSRNLHAYY